MESVRSYSPTGISLPRVLGGSAPALAVSGPARCLLHIRPADSPSRLRRPSTSEASAASLPPPLLRLLPGGANQFPGRDFQPAVDQRLFTAHQHPLASVPATRTALWRSSLQAALYVGGRKQVSHVDSARLCGIPVESVDSLLLAMLALLYGHAHDSAT